MNWKEYITADPNILFGKPVIRGTRVPVDLILEKMSFGESPQQLLDAYPHIDKESIFACLAFAADAVRNETTISLAS